MENLRVLIITIPVLRLKPRVHLVAAFWIKKMSLYRYFKRIDGLPDPWDLCLSISSDAIAQANREVKLAMYEQKISKRRGSYNNYTPELRAEMGKLAHGYGTSAAKCHFCRKLKQAVTKSTVQSIKNSYEEELKRQKGRQGSGTVSSLQKLPTKPHGRPLLLGDKVDTLAQFYLRKVREGGGVV